MGNHISSIKIESFRGIKSLELENLQPINILTGDNNCGKTSVLEVIQSFAMPENFRVWRNIIRRNTTSVLRNGITLYEGFYDLFDINEEDKKLLYEIELTTGEKYKIVLSAEESEEEMSEKELEKKQGFSVGLIENDLDNVQLVSRLDLEVSVNGKKVAENSIYEGQVQFLINSLRNEKNSDNKIVYISPVRHAEGMIYLGKVLDYPELYQQMLQVLREYDEDIISINYDADERPFRKGNYKILSKMHKKALPLDVYGDGMKKAVLMMSAVVSAKDGILLLDEFETAIHTSAMDKTFKWILETCMKLNVQVFFTSHSKEAIDKLLKCSPECAEKMAVYTLYKDLYQTDVRRLTGEEAIEAQDDMGLELR